ncbi:DUF2304 domain-containing protein [Candidatus Woesearchaeota archaeon]|nr:DUF2304 domain-containing protein [Candidatus Woesearchaeota archaeon]
MAEILGVQIIGALFGAFMMYYTFLHYKRREFKKTEYAFWFALWALFIIVTIVPNVLDPIVKTFSFARTLDLFIITGFLFLAGISFYMYTATRKTQNKLEQVVRKIAFKEAKKKG